MVPATQSRLAIDFAHAIVPLTSKVRDDETLFGMIADAPVVLLEASTHGTHEFYRARIEITKRLVEERGFTAVCAASDWPGFAQFPPWMRRNAEMLEFARWLREHNRVAALRGRKKVSVHGLDPFNDASTEAPLAYAAVSELIEARGDAKTVVWTHDDGDAPPRFQRRAVSIRFTTYAGTVTAAPRWGAPAEPQHLAPARGDSYEYLFHTANVPRFLLPLRPYRPKLAGLPQQARERAIGIVYDPNGEPHDHYRTSRLIDRYDALYHFDVTRAIDPSSQRPAVIARNDCG